MTIEIFQRIKRIDSLIQRKSTGTPSELANKIGMSKGTVYEYLNMMRELGAPIRYCPHRCTYYYDEDGHLNISFVARNHDSSVSISTKGR